MKLKYDELNLLKDGEFFREKINNAFAFLEENGIAVLPLSSYLFSFDYNNDTLNFEIAL